MSEKSYPPQAMRDFSRENTFSNDVCGTACSLISLMEFLDSVMRVNDSINSLFDSPIAIASDAKLLNFERSTLLLSSVEVSFSVTPLRRTSSPPPKLSSI